MNLRLFCLAILLSSIGLIFAPASSWGHGVEGQRFFVESVSVDDPFASDEMDLLYFGHSKDADGNNQNIWSGGISKRLSPNLGIGADWEYDDIGNTDGSTTRGFNNLGLHIKYMMVHVPEHEFLATVSLDWDVGGTGNIHVTGDSHSTLTPNFLFGYGLGDLPDALGYLKPFAITGQIGIASTLRPHNPDSSTEIDYGLVVEYSLLYLQSYVKDIGISWPFNRLVPMVEFTGASPLVGSPTITAYPGLTWAGRFYQMTVEAITPLSQPSGNAGVQFLLHLYLDDMFPKTYTWTPFYGVLGGTQR
jgi:hypothetical protein